MYVRFWGTRGSIAKPGASTLRYPIKKSLCFSKISNSLLNSSIIFYLKFITYTNTAPQISLLLLTTFKSNLCDQV